MRMEAQTHLSITSGWNSLPISSLHLPKQSLEEAIVKGGRGREANEVLPHKIPICRRSWSLLAGLIVIPFSGKRLGVLLVVSLSSGQLLCCSSSCSSLLHLQVSVSCGVHRGFLFILSAHLFFCVALLTDKERNKQTNTFQQQASFTRCDLFGPKNA